MNPGKKRRAFNPLPSSGTVFLSVSDRDKERAVATARDLHELGFRIVSTGGPLAKLAGAGIPAGRVYKVLEQARPNIIDMMKNQEIHFVINTPSTHESRADEVLIRSTAMPQSLSFLLAHIGFPLFQPRETCGMPANPPSMMHPNLVFLPALLLWLSSAVISPAQQAVHEPPPAEAGQDLFKQVLGYWVIDFDSAKTKDFIATLSGEEAGADGHEEMIDIRGVASGALMMDPHFPPGERKYFRAP